MKRTSNTDSAANTTSAQFGPVTTTVVATPIQPVPRLREDERQTSLHSLPDELMRQVGKYLTLREWVALRQLCKACAEQVDRQPPFVLLNPDVRTEKLLQQFLEHATPEYAFRLGNLVAKLKIGWVFDQAKLDSILEAIGKAQAWEVMKIGDSCSSSRLASFSLPLLRALNAGRGNMKRKLDYMGKMDKSDRASAEQVQRSSSLQLTALKTAEVSEFLPFIGSTAEFTNLELDLKHSVALTRETLKALQKMQGSIKCMTLRHVGQCDSSEVHGAISNKGLESLKLFNRDMQPWFKSYLEGDPGNGIDLQPWLTKSLVNLELDGSACNASTFAQAIGSSRTLKTLAIYGDLRTMQGDAQSAAAETDILSTALRMNQTIETLLLRLGNEEACGFVPAELLNVILNHGALKHLEWGSKNIEWPMLAAPENPKAMDQVFFKIHPDAMLGAAYFLHQLDSLKCLRLEISEFNGCNWEFLSTFTSLGLEEFCFSKSEKGYECSPPLPVKKCFCHGLRRLELSVDDDSNYAGMDAALASTTSLISLTLNYVIVDWRVGNGLINGLEENESLEELNLNMCDDGPCSETIMRAALVKASVIETIFNHPRIVEATLDFKYHCTEGTETYMPAGYAELLPHLDPALELVLSETTDIPPDEATPEEIRSVSEVYERIVETVRIKLQS